MHRRTVIYSIAALILLATLVLLLGGSAVWQLTGNHSLDIVGVAEKHGGPDRPVSSGWQHYGGDPGGSRFVNASQITPDNVDELEVAWLFSTDDLKNRDRSLMLRSAGETTPILVEDSLVFCTPFNEVIALDPGTGSVRWRHDPQIDLTQRPANNFICRGVSYWQGNESEGLCASRIISATSDGTVIALDARNGAVCSDFGNDGTVTIDPGMDLEWPGEFQVTSPPVVIDDVVVVGSAISDNARVRAPHGTVRAYDARSGEQLWWFDPIPRAASDANAGDWQGSFPPVEGHANAWAPLSADHERGLVFVPTSSPSPDFYGGLRPGDNRYANSVVALAKDTGQVVWAYQVVHHDVWDYDIPAQPGLHTLWTDDGPRDVVVQITKMGFIFVLDRETGEPVLPVEERSVPQNPVSGEQLSPTQPFPLRPPPVIPQTTTAEDAFGITLIDRLYCEEAISALRTDGLYTPPTESGTLFRPFTGGGGNWGGGAFDASRNLLLVNMTNIGHLIQLVPSDQIRSVREAHHNSEIAPQTGAPWGVRREILVSPFDLPCTAPPWGVLAAVDVAEGKIVWRRTLGTTEDLAAGLALELGTPTLGGPIVTASGLIFIGGTFDFYLRAFDVSNGTELWRGRLPAAGIATPMSYEYNGRQYVVISAGGYPDVGIDPGDSIVAFALPR